MLTTITNMFIDGKRENVNNIRDKEMQKKHQRKKTPKKTRKKSCCDRQNASQFSSFLCFSIGNCVRFECVVDDDKKHSHEAVSLITNSFRTNSVVQRIRRQPNDAVAMECQSTKTNVCSNITAEHLFPVNGISPSRRLRYSIPTSV